MSERNYEFLKALYGFKATFAKTLSFRENELFILHPRNAKDHRWWQVINMSGQVGFIPSNYVSVIQVSPQCCLEFLSHCIDALQGEKTPSAELLEYLLDMKHGVELVCAGVGVAALPAAKKKAPPPPTATSLAGPDLQLENIHDVVKQNRSSPNESEAGYVQESSPISKPAQLTVKSSAPTPATNSTSRGKITVTTTVDTGAETAYQMVEKVRRHTQLSHEGSRVAVCVVVSSLRDLLPPSVSDHLDAILGHLERPLSALRPSCIEDTHDARRLRLIFSELTSCKDDSQQRSWNLHEDEHTILDYLSELSSILMNADPDICRHVMARDKYSDVMSLVHYYQMETRWSIRKSLLRVFASMCSLEAAIVHLLFNSVLPAELARDMRSNLSNRERLSQTAVLLTMLLSMGEPMPVTHNDHLGIGFVDFVLNLVEGDLNSAEDEQLCDVMLNLILSYNLQFTSTADNLVLKALEKWTVVKNFTEKTLLLLNREEDPVRVFDHQAGSHHSVLKLFIDLFTNEITALLFYTNDTKVLIDIVVRRLTDLSPGDKRRRDYLQLCRLVMRNTGYGDHLHLLDQIRKCFTRIFCEESELSRPDQALVRDISNQFPQYFKE